MCEMANDQTSSTLNFTVLTGDTIPDQELGPIRDHTNNSTFGGFLYWDQQLSVNISDKGRAYLSKTIEKNSGMCIRFAYYVKSKLVNKNTTIIRLSSDESSGTGLWYQSLADSEGWQIALIPLGNVATAVRFYFDVYRLESILTSIAFDDIEIDQCSSFEPTTTSTSTTTTTTSTSTTTISTSSITTITTSTVPSSTSTTTTQNHTSPLFSMNFYGLIIHCLLVHIFSVSLK